jgi:S1-C subfamily serine protease
VSWLDLIVVVVAVAAAVGGYRLGFVTRVVSWFGLVIGIFLAIRFLPRIVERFDGADPNVLLLLSLAVVVLGSMVGQSVGFAIGARFRPDLRSAARADHVLGAAAGFVGVVAFVWLTLPVLTDTPGWVSDQTRRSAIAQNLSDHLPDAPDSMVALRALIGEDAFPKVFDALRPTPDLGPAPEEDGLSATIRDTTRASVVKVEGIACNRVQDGTGFVVGPDLVATNAHVIAGEGSTELERDNNTRVSATVVVYDPERDLAILRADGLNLAPLAIGTSAEQKKGGVFGHPGGGALRIAPFEVARGIRAVGRDIYGERITTRNVLELRANLRPGDSGSALVDEAGVVVGVAFAIAPDKPGVAYALSTTELQAVLAGDLTKPVGTGRCTTG